jgi:hypothetical protein
MLKYNDTYIFMLFLLESLNILTYVGYTEIYFTIFQKM